MGDVTLENSELQVAKVTNLSVIYFVPHCRGAEGAPGQQADYFPSPAAGAALRRHGRSAWIEKNPARQ